MTITLLKKQELKADHFFQITELFKQLSPNKVQQDLDKVFAENNPVSLVAYFENDVIKGIASLSTYTVISGNKGWIEDVIVDHSTRGKGIGKLLIQKLIELAWEKELTEVLLFTEDHRTPAIQLYKSLGFNPKDTRLYALKRGSVLAV